MTIDIIFTISMVITSLGVIAGAFVATYRLTKRIEQSIGTDKSGRTLAERLDRVEHQLWENGGSSLADRVNEIEKHSVNSAAKLDVIEKILTSQWWAQGVPEEKPETPKKTRIKKVS
jgi:hypothetical protein